ncbi:MAG TPA: aminotransferase class V-fold PLP-dependent enzyme [Pyrinomonadaceae bacterium]|jgi:aromatic-L-amino-acid decarboxylase|nr:aminotransferase class V-fold PLP-dependent enzyme [Pyrinomonadaceae bacterium]
MNDESLSAQHERIGRAATQIIAEHAARLDSLPINSGATPAEMKELFDESLPLDGTPAAEILEQFAREIAPHAQQVPSPRYFGQFNPTPLAIGVWADALCSSLNQNAGAWRNGPTSAMVESQTLLWLCELIGYSGEAFGVLASGGSEANLIALKCARDRSGESVGHRGIRAVDRDLVFYGSEQCHFSVEKSLDILGLGRQSFRKIQTDERFHIRVGALRRTIKDDLDAGRRPCCIVGVAGTTSTGVIDPLPELSEIAKENDCWFHVDAAYGGALAFSEQHKTKLQGIELADSITFDPHKWMFVPFACAATLVREGGQVLRDSFDMSPEYLSEDRGFSDAEYDFFRYGQMGTRRFNALKLWMCLKFMGKRGYSETVERHIELTQYFAAQLDALADFERVGEIETAVCCFRYLPDTVRARDLNDQDRVQANLQQRVERSRKAFFASTVLHGRRALRVNVNSYLTERRHIDDLVELLKTEAPRAMEV